MGNIIDLHGKTVEEAMSLVEQQIEWVVKHGEDYVVFNHGRGLHSQFCAKIRSAIRGTYMDSEFLEENGYKMIRGEDPYEITTAFNDGNTLVVRKGREVYALVDNQRHIETNNRIYSLESKEERKNRKKNRKKARRGVIGQSQYYPKTTPGMYRIAKGESARVYGGRAFLHGISVGDLLSEDDIPIKKFSEKHYEVTEDFVVYVTKDEGFCFCFLVPDKLRKWDMDTCIDCGPLEHKYVYDVLEDGGETKLRTYFQLLKNLAFDEEVFLSLFSEGSREWADNQERLARYNIERENWERKMQLVMSERLKQQNMSEEERKEIIARRLQRLQEILDSVAMGSGVKLVV